MKKNYAYILSIFLLATSICHGTNPVYDSNARGASGHLTTQNGLSGNTITSFSQDTKGFLWLGTTAGLNRYDGREVSNYSHEESNPHSLSSTYITSLLPDADGRVWVGTSEGLNYYNPVNESFQRIYLHGYGNEYSSNNHITALYKDKAGYLWIGTPDGVFCLRNSKAGKFTRILFKKLTPRSYQHITSICEDHTGNLWIGTKGGLIMISHKGEKKTAYVCYRKGISPGLTDDYISAIVEDSRKQLWVGTDNGGLSHFDPKNRNFIPVPSNSWSITALMADRNGQLWIAAPNRLAILDVSSEKVTLPFSSDDNSSSTRNEGILCLFEDRAGSVWIGGFQGASVTHLIDLSFRTEKSCISNTGQINAISQGRQQSLVIGTERGLCNIPINQAEFAGGDFKSVEAVKAIIKGFDQSIWVGSSSTGLWQFGPDGTITRYLHDLRDTTSSQREYVICLLEDTQRRLWVGTRSGLLLLDRRTGKFIHFMDSKPIALSGRINTFFEDSKKNLWIGTNKGLCLLRYTTGKFEWFPTISRQSISYGKGAIATIYEDKYGHLLVGTVGDGLKCFDMESNTLVPYALKGLPSHVINLLDDSDGNLWLTSFYLLYKVDQTRKTVRSYNFYDRIPGYQISERSSYKSDAGELFFGTNQGLLRFFPEQIKENPTPPPVTFTSLNLPNKNIEDLQTNGKPSQLNITETKNVTLGHHQDSFIVSFSVLNYVKPEKNQYAYKLDGLEDSWNYSTSPRVSYHRLAPGTYTLLAKGANNDGIWNEQPTSLEITVLPPWWRTWRAYCLYTAVFASVSFLLIRFLWLRATLMKEKEMHRQKMDFFTNVSHEIRSHLMLISGPIEKLLRSEKVNKDVHRQLGNIQANSARLSGLVKELMDFRKAESANLKLNVTKNDLVFFLKNIFSAFSQLAELRNIESSFVSNSDSIECWFDKDQFEKTIYNLLSNAYKFTPDHGYVRLEIENQDKHVKITVVDNGKGITKENLKKVFLNYFQVYDPGLVNLGHGLGLALSKSIIELHKGSLTVESTPAGKGLQGLTAFTIDLLKGKNHFTPDQIADQFDNAEERTSITLDKSDDLAETIDEKKEKYTILIAENHDEFRNLIRDSLSDNYEVIACMNGKDAYNAALTNIPDVIVSDIIMPEMNGLELCKRIKTHETTSHIPVLLLTAHDSQEYELKGFRHGADAYITKPFKFEILELKIRNRLAARKAIQQKFSSRILLEPGKEVVVNNREEQFMNNLLTFVEENMDNPRFSVTMLSKHLGMSEPVLYKKVRALLNMTVNDFIKTIKLKRAAKMLRDGISPTDVSISIGYTDHKYFSREFKKTFGVTPGKWIDMPDVKQTDE